ncbi:phage holin [Mammaliicoccus sciuri]|uniref:phage holin n=1 Tax=Mammaliicoccus sciuri TaxID=1296 RepID=UPI0034DDC385
MPKDAGTWTRLVLLILALINGILTASGKSPLPIDEQELSEFISLGFIIVTGFAGYFMNNSHTLAGKEGTDYTRALKKGDIPIEVVQEDPSVEYEQNSTPGGHVPKQ